MPAYVRVFTFKSGLLSRLAHDLRLRCESWRIAIEAGAITATFDPTSLRVDGVMKDGRLDPHGLSSGDYRKIEATIREEILRTDRHDAIAFAGRLAPVGDDVVVEGELTLVGRTAAIGATRAHRRNDTWMMDVELVPSRWNIAPYRALAGALKLQDRVRVQIELPAIATLDPSSGTHTFTA